MTSDDKTPTRSPGRDWAKAIPLVTILGMVFGAGVIWAGQQRMSRSIDDMSRDLRDSTAASNARIRALEEYRIAHEAMTTPMMQKFLEEHTPKKGGKR